jgi:transcription initiation factor TFIID subunit 2
LYICNVIASLACAVVPDRPPERGELSAAQANEQSGEDKSAEDKQLLQLAVTEVVRYRNMDRLVPSTHNVVTVAALEVSAFIAVECSNLDAFIVPPHFVPRQPNSS